MICSLNSDALSNRMDRWSWIAVAVLLSAITLAPGPSVAAPIPEAPDVLPVGDASPSSSPALRSSSAVIPPKTSQSPKLDLRFKPGELLVVLESPRAAAKAQGFSTMGYRPSRLAVGLERAREIMGGRLYRFELPDFRSVEYSLIELRRHPDVVHVQPNYLYQTPGLSRDRKHHTPQLTSPSDPDYSRQWYLQRAEDTPSINAPRAWDHLSGDSSVVVAVLDQGIDTDHPDIKDRLTIVNKSDVADSDSNPDATPIPRDQVSGTCQTAGVLGNSGYDTEVHGTHVAGVLGAVWNAQYVSGVDPVARVMPIRVFDWTCDDSTGNTWVSLATTEHLVEGINTARNHGADVINLSLASRTETDDALLRSAIQGAHDEDIVLVAAAGNDGLSPVSYPAGYDTTVAVGAYRSPPDNKTADRAQFSNYGDSLDIMAPGIDMLSLYPNAISGGSAVLNGTSQATPLVSGAVSLFKARFPDSSARQIETRLFDATQALGNPAQTGRSDLYGHGLVDLVKLTRSRIPSPGGITVGNRVDPINRLPQGFSSLVSVNASSHNRFLQVDLNYGDTTTGDLVTAARGEFGTDHHVSYINSAGDTVQLAIWTDQERSSVFLGRRNDPENLDASNLPTGITDSETGRKLMERTGLLVEFSNGQGSLLGTVSTTTDVSDTFAFNLLYKLTPATTQLFQDHGYNTSANSDDFAFFTADEWEDPWRKRFDVSVSVTSRSDGGINVKVTGIAVDLPGALGGTSGFSPASLSGSSGGGNGGGGCLVQRAGVPGWAQQYLRQLRDGMLRTRLGRWLTKLYYHL